MCGIIFQRVSEESGSIAFLLTPLMLHEELSTRRSSFQKIDILNEEITTKNYRNRRCTSWEDLTPETLSYSSCFLNMYHLHVGRNSASETAASSKTEGNLF